MDTNVQYEACGLVGYLERVEEVLNRKVMTQEVVQQELQGFPSQTKEHITLYQSLQYKYH